MAVRTVITFIFHMLVMDSLKGLPFLRPMTLETDRALGTFQSISQFILQIDPVCVPVAACTLQCGRCRIHTMVKQLIGICIDPCIWFCIRIPHVYQTFFNRDIDIAWYLDIFKSVQGNQPVVIFCNRLGCGLILEWIEHTVLEITLFLPGFMAG